MEIDHLPAWKYAWEKREQRIYLKWPKECMVYVQRSNNIIHWQHETMNQYWHFLFHCYATTLS